MRREVEGSGQGPAEAARKIEAGAPVGGDFTYAVLTPGEARGGERRLGERQPTRLRSGKLVRADGHFLCECLVHNRSATGRRLRLPDGALDVPPMLFFYDDLTELLFHGRVIWRKQKELGLRLSACASTPFHRSILGAMRRKFYMLSD